MNPLEAEQGTHDTEEDGGFPAQGDANAHDVASRGRDPDPVEAALATALERASAAGEWSTVGLLARELEARRAARTPDNVVRLPDLQKGRS